MGEGEIAAHQRPPRQTDLGIQMEFEGAKRMIDILRVLSKVCSRLAKPPVCL